MVAVDTGTIYNASTNADGIYSFPSLPIGAYHDAIDLFRVSKIPADRHSSESTVLASAIIFESLCAKQCALYIMILRFPRIRLFYSLGRRC